VAADEAGLPASDTWCDVTCGRRILPDKELRHAASRAPACDLIRSLRFALPLAPSLVGLSHGVFYQGSLRLETPIRDNIRELVTWECKEHGVKS
jgi:hypothetical protein